MEKVDPTIVSHIVYTFYNITPMDGGIVPLIGYSDKNFSITDVVSRKKHVLKIVNEEDSSNQRLQDIIDETVISAYEYSKDDRDFSIARIFRTCNEKLNSQFEVELRNDEDVTRKALNNVKLMEYLPGVTVDDFINDSSRQDCSLLKQIYWKLGIMCGNITYFFATKSIYRDELALLREGFEWQTCSCHKTISKKIATLFPNEFDERRLMVVKVLEQFQAIKEKFNTLPRFIIHGDLSDLQVGPRIVELAVLLLYSVLEQVNLPFEEAIKRIPKRILEGYLRSNIAPFFHNHELEFVPIIMKLRLCLSLINGLEAFKKDSTNDYVLNTNKKGWTLLKIMLDVEPYNNDIQLIDFWLPSISVQ